MSNEIIKPTKDLQLTEKERKLIELMRGLRFFKIVVHGEDGQPVRVKEIQKNIQL